MSPSIWFIYELSRSQTQSSLVCIDLSQFACRPAPRERATDRERLCARPATTRWYINGLTSIRVPSLFNGVLQPNHKCALELRKNPCVSHTSGPRFGGSRLLLSLFGKCQELIRALPGSTGKYGPASPQEPAKELHGGTPLDTGYGGLLRGAWSQPRPRRYISQCWDAQDQNRRLHHRVVGRSGPSLDYGEVHLKQFDVVIQRGTNHAWVNRGTEKALLAAVLIDAEPMGI